MENEDFALQYIDYQINKAEKTAKRQWYYYLNGKLIKEKKPCFDNDYIHLHCINGCFKVFTVNASGFIIKVKGTFHKYPWSEFRCLKGQGISDLKLLKQTNRTINNVKTTLTTIQQQLGRRF